MSNNSKPSFTDSEKEGVRKAEKWMGMETDNCTPVSGNSWTPAQASPQSLGQSWLHARGHGTMSSSDDHNPLEGPTAYHHNVGVGHGTWGVPLTPITTNDNANGLLRGTDGLKCDKHEQYEETFTRHAIAIEDLTNESHKIKRENERLRHSISQLQLDLATLKSQPPLRHHYSSGICTTSQAKEIGHTINQAHSKVISNYGWGEHSKQPNHGPTGVEGLCSRWSKSEESETSPELDNSPPEESYSNDSTLSQIIMEPITAGHIDLSGLVDPDDRWIDARRTGIIRCQMSQTLVFNVGAIVDTWDLKEAWAEQTGLDHRRFELCYRGEVLNDHVMLSDYTPAGDVVIEMRRLPSAPRH